MPIESNIFVRPKVATADTKVKPKISGTGNSKMQNVEATVGQPVMPNWGGNTTEGRSTAWANSAKGTGLGAGAGALTTGGLVLGNAARDRRLKHYRNFVNNNAEGVAAQVKVNDFSKSLGTKTRPSKVKGGMPIPLKQGVPNKAHLKQFGELSDNLGKLPKQRRPATNKLLNGLTADAKQVVLAGATKGPKSVAAKMTAIADSVRDGKVGPRNLDGSPIATGPITKTRRVLNKVKPPAPYKVRQPMGANPDSITKARKLVSSLADNPTAWSKLSGGAKKFLGTLLVGGGAAVGNAWGNRNFDPEVVGIDPTNRKLNAPAQTEFHGNILNSGTNNVPLTKPQDATSFDTGHWGRMYDEFEVKD